MFRVALCDYGSDFELADLSEVAITKKVSPRLSLPGSVVITLPGDTAAIRDTSFDGRPNLDVGRRLLKVYDSDAPGTGLVANTLIWTSAPSGDENTTSIDVTGYDPMILFPYRVVRDDTGAFAAPTFPSPISGAEILQLAIANTITFDGAFPIDLTGPIASSLDLGVDLSNWPMTLADLYTTLINTGALDVLMNPVDTHSGFPAGTIAQMTVADHLGQDLTGSVHFDYGLGDFSIAQIRRTFDMSTLCNKLWYYLGPRGTFDNRHYRSNITGTETGAAPGSEDLSAYEALQLASRDLYGVFMGVKVFDDNDHESSNRKLWHEAWKTEVLTRTSPRELLSITPAAGAGCPFQPWVDYNPGDLVTMNASDIVGPAFTGAFQRIYGFDVIEDQNGVKRVGELIVSEEAA